MFGSGSFPRLPPCLGDFSLVFFSFVCCPLLLLLSHSQEVSRGKRRHCYVSGTLGCTAGQLRTTTGRLPPRGLPDGRGQGPMPPPLPPRSGPHLLVLMALSGGLPPGKPDSPFCPEWLSKLPSGAERPGCVPGSQCVHVCAHVCRERTWVATALVRSDNQQLGTDLPWRPATIPVGLVPTSWAHFIPAAHGRKTASMFWRG